MAADSGPAELCRATEKRPQNSGPSLVAGWGDSSAGRMIQQHARHVKAVS